MHEVHASSSSTVSLGERLDKSSPEQNGFPQSSFQSSIGDCLGLDIILYWCPCSVEEKS